MIVDKVDNISLYSNSPAWSKAMKFLENLTSDCEDGEYEIEGNQIFARVMTYDTKFLNDSFPEAHIKYLDIQVVLSGEELVLWYPLGELELKTSYDEKTDVAFYDRNISVMSETILSPGFFMAFFPDDAHMPSISINETPMPVKKVVIKIAVDYIKNIEVR